MLQPAKLLLLRFGLGAAGGAVASVLAYRSLAFTANHHLADATLVGLLLAAQLALVRGSEHRKAALLALLFVLIRFVLRGFGTPTEVIFSLLADLVLAFGILLVAVIYDLLAGIGPRVGKFLLVGPLLGGLYLAVTLVAEFPGMHAFGSILSMLLSVFLGCVVGNGVGFGVELAEFRTHSSGPATDTAAGGETELTEKQGLADYR